MVIDPGDEQESLGPLMKRVAGRQTPSDYPWSSCAVKTGRN